MDTLQTFVAANWGSIASVVGLLVSFVTLLVARKAKIAADGARKEAHRRNRAEDLTDAHTKSEQVGLFIRDSKWDMVFLRSQEIASVCSVVLSRWNDQLTDDSRTQIILARDQAGSIAKVAMRANRILPTEQQLSNISAAQRRLNELLSTELGEALRLIERNGLDV